MMNSVKKKNGNHMEKNKRLHVIFLSVIFGLAVFFALFYSVKGSKGGSTPSGTAEQHFQAAAGFAKKGMADEELDELEKTIALDPRFTPAYEAIGICCVAHHNYPKAAWAFRFATILDPKNPGYFLDLGIASLKAKRKNDALSALDNAAKLAPSDPGFYAELGKAYSEAGDTKNAKTWNQKAKLAQADQPEKVRAGMPGAKGG